MSDEVTDKIRRWKEARDSGKTYASRHSLYTYLVKHHDYYLTESALGNHLRRCCE